MKSFSRIISVSTALFLCFFAFAQTRQTPKEYKEKFDQDAVVEMIKSGVPASITLAQGMLESDYGNSVLAKKAKNHFGIKCHSSWTGKKYHMDDDADDECFRVYSTVYESYVDHSDFLRNNRRYAFLFDLKQTNYKGWARGLKKAGYATNPKYPDLLIKIIEENKLYLYDKMTKSDLKSLGASSSNNRTERPKEGKKSNKKQSSKKETAGRDLTIKLSKNNIKYIISKGQDTPDKIAKRYNMGRWQICNYNNLKSKSKIAEGSYIYLQPKRYFYQGKQQFHIVKKGDTLWKISQMYGLKIISIKLRNGIKKGDKIKVGQKIWLKKH